MGCGASADAAVVEVKEEETGRWIYARVDLRVGQIALGEYWPDLVVVFDVDEQTASTRLNPLLDRMEQKGKEYHRRVRKGYLDQAEADPKRYLVIDARPSADEVTETLLKQLTARLG